ncbi:hypothetical protein [Azospirillum sp.]|uniref:hypothetical protein n=1 Tax=Azospirillum sp. TaxID=34012 RepID=UPI003D751102
MRKRHHLWAVAGLLVGRYGHAAPAQAEAYARQAERDGDGDAHAIWNDVAGALHGRRAAPRHAPRAEAD